MEHKHNHIVYTCKECGWQASIHESWGDKPKRCGGRKCKTSFRKEPDKLEKSMPADRAPKKKAASTPQKSAPKPKPKRKSKDDGQEGQRKEETTTSEVEGS